MGEGTGGEQGEEWFGQQVLHQPKFKCEHKIIGQNACYAQLHGTAMCKRCVAGF